MIKGVTPIALEEAIRSHAIDDQYGIIRVKKAIQTTLTKGIDAGNSGIYPNDSYCCVFKHAWNADFVEKGMFFRDGMWHRHVYENIIEFFDSFKDHVTLNTYLFDKLY